MTDSNRPKLMIVITSVRERRAGDPVARWFIEQAEHHAGFEIDVVDLKTLNLPLLDEPNHPMKRSYEHAPTIAWSERVAKADAFVFVVPEYNYGMPPALLNALDYLYHEWNYKAAAFVSYGGISGGTRSVSHAKQILTTLKMMPLPEQVTLPFFSKSIGEDGKLAPGGPAQASAKGVLDELGRWTGALKTLRPAG